MVYDGLSLALIFLLFSSAQEFTLINWFAVKYFHHLDFTHT
jgi:hypothetical protein